MNDQCDRSALANRWRHRLRVALCVGTGSLLLSLSVGCAYYMLFSTFQVYDDEGWVLLNVRHFVDGAALYDQSASPYGPFFYSVKLVFHTLLGIGLTNDNVRWIAMLFWLATAGIIGLSAWRMTGRAALACLASALTFLFLNVTTLEPGHPQELCGLLIALLVLISTASDRLSPRQMAAALGAVAACLALTKVNIGAFAGLSLLLSIMAATPGRRARVSFIALGGAALLLPFLLLIRELGTRWGLCYALLVGLGTLALLVRALHLPREFQVNPWNLIASFGGAFLLAGMIPVAVVMLRGTTLSGMAMGLIIEPRLLVLTFGHPAPLSVYSPAWIVLSAVIFQAYQWTSKRHVASALVRLGLDVLKLGFAALVCYSIFTGGRAIMLNFPITFLWLLFTPSAGQKPASMFPRLTLGLLAVLQSLQAYPVPGSQVCFGTFLFVLVGVVCLGDAIGSLEQSCAASYARHALRVALPAVAGLATIWVGWTGCQSRDSYAQKYPVASLASRGAGGIRFDERTAATVQWLVANLDHHADRFQCTTGFNSLFFWTGKAPATRNIIASSLDAISQPQQQAIVDSLRQSPGACVIYHPSYFSAPRRGSPLLDEIESSYVSCGSVNHFTFLVRADRDLPTLVDCVCDQRLHPKTSAAGHVVVSANCLLAPVCGATLDRLCLVDLDQRAVLADSRPNGAPSIAVYDAASTPVLRGTGLTLSQPRKLKLVFQAPSRAANHFLVLRCLDSDGTILKSIPFLGAGPVVVREDNPRTARR